MGRFAISCLFFLFALIFKAQDEQVFSLKPALALNACQVHGDTYIGFNKLGFGGGLYINARLKEKLSLEFGIIYNQKGARHNANPEKGDYRYYFLRLDYIEVPVILRYQPKGRFYLTFGPSFGYLANYYQGNENGDITAYLSPRRYEFSVNAGLGMRLTTNMSFEIRSNNSFISIRPFTVPVNFYGTNVVAQTFNDGLYNNILEFIVFYRIPTKKKSETAAP